VRVDFVKRVLKELDLHGSFLAVCAGEAERDVLPAAHLSDISNGEDAQALPYEDMSFDFAFVSDGLHHCSRPHAALAEMYRVARHGIIVVESRDSMLVRLAVRLGLTQDYEVSAVESHGGRRGGVNDTAVPNHVYRWTEREFEKTLRSLDPTGPIHFRYLYAVSLPDRLARLRPLQRPVSRLVGRQANTFAMAAFRPTTTWSWLMPTPADQSCSLLEPDDSDAQKG
jgi:SAM-dependent methyltransferase